MGQRRQGVTDGLNEDNGKAEDRVVEVEPPAEDRHQHQEAEHLARVHEGQEVRVVVLKSRKLRYSWYRNSCTHRLPNEQALSKEVELTVPVP